MTKHTKVICPNLNHGKGNAGVRFCPSCGGKFRSTATGLCDPQLHAARRKARNLFCIDCGKDLSK